MAISFYYFWTFVFGLCFGSFANVVVLRDGERASILTGRSHCPSCRHTLAWYDLLPLLSFLQLGGRCRYCRTRISWQYPLVELLAGLLLCFSFWYGVLERGSWLLAGGLALACLLFLIMSIIDLRTMQVSLEYCLAAGLVGLLAGVLGGQHTLAQALLGLLVGAGSLALVLYGWKLLFKQDGMGEGDIWLAGAVGATVGYPLVVVALLAAVMLGAVSGLVLIGLGKKKLQNAVPFGPFLFLGLLVALIWGQALIRWYIL